jgi:hypothetical protein
MTRFYINFRNGDQIAQDEVGIDLPCPEEARAFALVSARELLAQNIKSASDTPLEAVIITDESGREIMTIPAKEILPEPLIRLIKLLSGHSRCS